MVQLYTIMHKHIVGVSKSTKLGAALKLMHLSGVTLVPVLDRGVLVGILKKHEIEEAIKKGADTDTADVAHVVSRNLFFAEETQDIDEAAKIMVKNRLPRLPIVNDKDKMVCVGMVSSTDILKTKKKAER